MTQIVTHGESVEMTWTGAPKLVNAAKVRWLGAWYVAEYRLRNMGKWIGAIIAFGLGNPVLYLFSVGLGVGALVDQSVGPNGVDGVSYLMFLAPALLATAAIQAAMDETSFPTLQGFVWDKSFFAMNSTQLSGGQIVNGIMIASMFRCLFTVFIYEAVLLAFGAIPWSTVIPLAFASMLAGWAFAIVMLAGISFVKRDDGVFAIIGRFVVTPLFMFSGTFYPLESLPIWLQPVGWISPLWHAADLGRFLSYGKAVEPWLVGVHYGYFIVMVAVGTIIGIRQFNRRLAK